MPISIVLSQALHQDPQRRDFEEQLVTMLIMEDGREVNVIPHLIGLEDDDSGMLCLEGMTAHIVALSWLSPVEAFTQLEALKIEGRFGRTRQSPTTPEPWADSQHPRAIYCLDLNQFESVDAVREEVKRIDQEQSVKVVSIGGALGGALGKRSTGSGPTTSPTEPTTSALENGEADASSVERAEAPSSPPEDVAEATDWDDDEALDRLVDELDDLDI